MGPRQGLLRKVVLVSFYRQKFFFRYSTDSNDLILRIILFPHPPDNLLRPALPALLHSLL